MSIQKSLSKKKAVEKGADIAVDVGKFVLGQIPIVGTAVDVVDVVYDVGKDGFEYVDDYSKLQEEIEENNDNIAKITEKSLRYINSLVIDNNDAIDDHNEARCYTATYYYKKDEIIKDDNTMVINEEAANEYDRNKESFEY